MPDVCQSPPGQRVSREGRARRRAVAEVQHHRICTEKRSKIREESHLRYLRSEIVNDDQPTTSFPRLPDPSAEDTALHAALPEPPPPAAPDEPPKGWRARRRARRAERESGGGDTGEPPPPPDGAGGHDLPGPDGEPAGLDVPEPLASSTRGLRRQRKRLLQRREEMVFHLGGLAYDLHLLGELEAPVITLRAGMIRTLDTTVDAIDAQLVARGKSGGGQRLPIVVGSCRTCQSLFVADARYCMTCGRTLAPPDPAEASA
jgi:hypothetical protein